MIDYMAWPRRSPTTSVVVCMALGFLGFISSLVYQRAFATTARTMAAADVQAPVISLSHGGGAYLYSFMRSRG